MADVVKDGLNERSSIPKMDTSHDRTGPNQVPQKATEKASKGGKSFTIK